MPDPAVEREGEKRLRYFTEREVEAIIEVAHDHGRDAERAIEHGEIDGDDQDALPLTIEAAEAAAGLLGVGLPSPTDRPVPPDTQEERAALAMNAEVNGGRPLSEACVRFWKRKAHTALTAAGVPELESALSAARQERDEALDVIAECVAPATANRIMGTAQRGRALLAKHGRLA
jgi:hypothetical protein